MSRKNNYNYFDTFIKLSNYCCLAAKMLDETLENFKIEDLQEKMELMHDIEHNADLEGHDMMRKLFHEFITPIDREDIVSLSHEIDNITDSIEDVLLRLYMYNIPKVRSEALEFSKIIVKSCEELKIVLEEFHNFKKSTEMHKGIILINKLEEEGDNLYTRAVRRLHMTSTDPIEIMTWTEVINRLEKCCDACENTANVVESIIMKNS